MGSVLGGGSEDELPAVLAKWRGLDYPPFIPSKSPGFCLTLVIPSFGVYSTSVDETDKIRILRRNRDYGQRAEHICGIVHTSTMANSIMDLLTQMPKR